jgi:hypothetical protein
MALHANYFLTCDTCGTDTGSSFPTIEEAIEHAERGGWSVYDLDGDDWDQIFCEDCLTAKGSSDES